MTGRVDLRALLHERAPAVWGSALLLLYVVAYGSWQCFGVGPSGANGHILTSDALCYPTDLAALAATFLASRRVRLSPRTARAWRLLCLGVLLLLLGDLTTNIYDAIGSGPSPLLADAFFLASFPLVLAGLLTFPVARRTRNDEVRVWMDIVVVTLAFSSLIVYLTVAQRGNVSGGLLQTIFTAAYPIGDVMLIAGIASALLRGSNAATRLPLYILGVALGSYVIGDLIYGTESLNGTYRAGGLVDMVWIITLALIAAAALWQRPLDRPESAAAPRDRVGQLPFLAAAFCFGVLAYTERGDGIFPGLAVTLLAIVVAGLLALRLYLGQRELILNQEELGHLALHDQLTGLPNRVLLADRLEHALARHARDHRGLAVLLADLDEFKLVNDSLGHASGDTLLIELAQRLRCSLRAGETLARLGGDEFCVLVEGIRSQREVDALHRRVVATFAEPFTLGGRSWRLSVSVGIALADGGACTASDLMRDADTAMYRAKGSGPGGYEVFDAAFRSQMLRRIELATELEAAIANDDFGLVYQPIVALADGEIVAFEQLVRWHHRDLGFIAPDEFIPVAEETGLIVPLGRLLFERAAAQIARWRVELPGLLPRGIGVNVSARELEEPDFAAFVASTLARRGLTSTDIGLELTERVFIDDRHPIVVANLRALSTEGFGLILDDFGSGYSALSSLKRFPLRALKIDRFFAAEIHSPGDDGPVIRAVVGLGRALGMKVTAEGIETKAQLDYVRTAGVDHGQGNLFAKPLTSLDAAELLASGPLMFATIAARAA